MTGKFPQCSITPHGFGNPRYPSSRWILCIIPAKAGIHFDLRARVDFATKWVPAFAGTTSMEDFVNPATR